MSTLHLDAGSKKPAEVKGQARLYSMKFCPFAHRIRLILALKKIPHDIVNINLQDKPAWYLKVHPEGKVPAFVDADGKIVTDSIDIANYINEKYPEPPLYNDATKTRDLELLDYYNKIIYIFSNCIHGDDKRDFNEIIEEMLGLLVEFEKELKTRGTVFYGGSQPGMLDILMWPWAERRKSLTILYNQPEKFTQENFPHIVKWACEMKAQPFVQENAGSNEKFVALIKNMRAGNVDYDQE